MSNAENEDKVAKNSCDKCRKAGFPVCIGHGASSNGDDNDESESYGKDNSVQPSDESITPALESQLSLKLEPKGWLFLLEKLADLKNNGMLIIDNNFEQGILTISTKVSPEGEAASVVEKYLEMLLEEFANFKKQLELEGQDLTGYTDTRTANGLVLRIPSAKNYDRFIEQLNNKGLLSLERPRQNADNSENNTPSVGMTPFKMVPTPPAMQSKKSTS